MPIKKKPLNGFYLIPLIKIAVKGIYNLMVNLSGRPFTKFYCILLGEIVIKKIPNRVSMINSHEDFFFMVCKALRLIKTYVYVCDGIK